MGDSTSRKKLLELIDAACDAQLSQAELAELEQLLRRDPQAAELYARHCELHVELWFAIRGECVQASIGEQLADEIDERADATQAEQPRPAGRRLVARVFTFATRPTPLAMLVAAMVLGLLITAMAFVAAPIYQRLAGPADNAPKIVAELTGIHQATWQQGQAGTMIGAHLPAGHSMALQSGLVEITYHDGVRVVLEGPCQFFVADVGAGRLESGCLFAQVPPAGQGFAITTPTATVVDLGTQFSVVASAEGTDVIVVQGVVELKPYRGDHGSADPAPRRLAAGEKLHVGADGQISASNIEPAEFARDLPDNSTQWSEESLAQAVLADDPVAYWPLNDGVDGTWADRAGGGLDGRRRGEVASGQRMTADSLCTGFNGRGAIETEPTAALRTTSGMTVEAWIWIDDVSSTAARIATYPECWGVGVLPDNRVRFTYWTVEDLDFDVQLPRKRWVHLAVAVDHQHVAKLYVNGRLRGEMASPAPNVPDPSGFIIGASTMSFGEPWHGRLAHVAVFDKPLTAEQIALHVRRAWATKPAASE